MSIVSTDTTRKIADESIMAVREKASLVEVVSERTALSSSHRGAVGRCPICSGDGSTFTVAVERGVYFCTDCGSGGDVTRFVMETQKVTFVEAVELLAERYGVVLRHVPCRPVPVVDADTQRDAGMAVVVMLEKLIHQIRHSREVLGNCELTDEEESILTRQIVPIVRTVMDLVPGVQDYMLERAVDIYASAAVQSGADAF